MTPGPPLKPPLLRRNRSPKRGGEWVELPAELDEPVLGPLPRRCNSEGPWSDRTRRMCAGWRADPATTMWGPADRSFALDTAYIEEENVRELRASFAAEIRIRMDNLGLTARGKRVLRWRVVEGTWSSCRWLQFAAAAIDRWRSSRQGRESVKSPPSRVQMRRGGA